MVLAMRYTPWCLPQDVGFVSIVKSSFSKVSGSTRGRRLGSSAVSQWIQGGFLIYCVFSKPVYINYYLVHDSSRSNSFVSHTNFNLSIIN
jgi:hypothetical protein